MDINFLEYIKPELLVLIPFLFVFGLMLKQAAFVKDNAIPLILGGAGILVALCYVAGDSEVFGATGIFTALTQGIMCAGAAVYSHQIIKQLKKKDGDDDVE
ncbi:MAG: phage holin family protein [Clostridia bacterium]|nr:phage holin family protein [Clostridia bacterium]